MFTEALARVLSKHCVDFRRDAFTLAEVLITLGIIGVVAAITMPTIVANVQKKTLESQYNKAKNRIGNGYRLMMSQVETTNIDETPLFLTCSSLTNNSCISSIHKQTFKILEDSVGNSNLKSKLPSEYTTTEDGMKVIFAWRDVPYIFITDDGTTYGVEADAGLKSLSVYSDVNSLKRPNSIKDDMYKFRVSQNGRITDVSDELLSNGCTIDNLSKCDTLEKCQGLATSDFVGDVFGATEDLKNNYGGLGCNGNKIIQWWYEGCSVLIDGGGFYCR